MNFIKILGAICLSGTTIASIGCGGSGGIPKYGASSTAAPYFQIQAVTTHSSEAWKNVSISGYADQNTLANACNPLTDTYCIPEIGGPFQNAFNVNSISSFKTDSNGRALFYTDAEPAIWYFYANGPIPVQTDCDGNAAITQTYQNEPTGSAVLLTCGSNTTTMIARPSACVTTIDQYGDFISSNCPETVSLSFPVTSSTPTALPLNTPLTAVDYSTTGANLSQASVTASSANSISVPVPTTTGMTYLAVQNPSTGTLFGVSEFTYSVRVVKCTPVNGSCN